MILFIPVLISIFLALIIAILGIKRLNIVESWLATVVSGILILLSFIIVRVVGVSSWSTPFLSISGYQDTLIRFQLDERNWMFGLLLIGVFLASIFSEASQIFTIKNKNAWFIALIITGLGILSIFSKSLIAYLFFSILTDLGVLLLLSTSGEILEPDDDPIRRFVFHSLGNLFILFGMIFQSDAGLLMVSIGVMLRFGFLSLLLNTNLRSAQQTRFSFFSDTIIPLVTFAYFYSNEIVIGEFTGKNLLLIVWTIIAIGAMLKSLTSTVSSGKSKGFKSINLWFGAFLLIEGKLSVLVPFVIVLVSMQTALTIFNGSGKLSKTFFLILLLGMIGIPYTPSHGIWLMFEEQQSAVFLIIYNVMLLIILIATGLFILKERTNRNQKQEWTEVFSSISPFFVLLILWSLDFWIKTISINIIDFIIPGLAFCGFFWQLISRKISFIQRRVELINSRSVTLRNKILSTGTTILSLKWAVKIIGKIFNLGSEMILVITRVLDGDGGLLWSFVFLVLLATVFMGNRYR